MKFPSWLIPAILLIVTIDQWVAATGEADPYKLTLIPFTSIPLAPAFSITSMARGIGIVLGISYGIGGIQMLVTSGLIWKKVVGVILVGFVMLLLVAETLVITPYIVTSMTNTEIARTIKGTTVFGGAITGEALYTMWALIISLIPPTGVIISALRALASVAETQQQSGKGKLDIAIIATDNASETLKSVADAVNFTQAQSPQK